MTNYTWAEYKADVRKYMPLESVRRNVGTSSSGEPYLDKLIRQGVLDLQSHIPLYRVGQESSYGFTDVYEANKSSTALLPDKSMPIFAWIEKVSDSCDYVPVFPYPWIDHKKLVCGQVESDCCPAYMAINPDGSQRFYLWPKLDADHKLVLVWDGIKAEFADADKVPFDERSAECVAHYAKWKLELEVNRDTNMAKEQERLFLQIRQQLYVDNLDKTRFRYSRTSNPARICAEKSD